MDWNSSALWGIIGLIGGFIISFTFYKLSTKKPKIVCLIDSNIISEQCLDITDNLDIAYLKKHNKKLIKTIIKISLSNNIIVNKNDFGKATPFCIKVKGKFFVNDINSIIKYNSNPNNLLELKIKNNSTILLGFDYLTKEDKITLVLLHTGALKVEGKLKNGTVINVDSFERTSNILDIVIGCCGMICLGGIFFLTLQETSTNILTTIMSCILGILMGILYIIQIFRKLFSFSHETTQNQIDSQ